MSPTTPSSTTAQRPDFDAWFEASPDAYLVLDRDLIVAGANDAYLRAAGAPREALLGRYLFDLFPDNPADPAASGDANLSASFARVLEQGVPDQMAVQRYDVAGPDGAFVERHWATLNTPVLDDQGRVQWILHRVEEVTNLRRLGLPVTPAEVEDYARKTQAALDSTEEQLRQAQKLEALGRLAGGVAHDFNNLLSVILSTAGLLRDDLKGNEKAREDLREIERAGMRAADLTRRLLAFSRQQVLDLRVLELAAVVNDFQPMLARLFQENIEKRVRIDREAGCIRGDKSQLEQVLLNLAVNARDAMPGGGLLGIEVSAVELSEEYAEGHVGVIPGRYVQLTVSDTGIGMDKGTQLRAFEPFFTTKPAGEGTGLGLSTVFGIVKQSGGFIWLYSEPGIGTTFKIYFPRVDEAPAAAVVEEAPERVGGTERVLVLEDDDAVRHSMVRILRRLGYDVAATGSAAEALVHCATVGAAPELLVTDVIMPEMNGRDVARRARMIVPGLKVLFVSGYTDDVILQQGILNSGEPYLQKPITPEALSRKVRGVLDG